MSDTLLLSDEQWPPTRTSPWLWVLDKWLCAAEVNELLDAVSPDALEASSVALREDSTGATAEIAVHSSPALERLVARITELVGLHNEYGHTFRLRRARAGASHPLHTDHYAIEGKRLWATVLVYLTECEAGITRFPHAHPPLQIQPQAGRVVVWFNLDRAGQTVLSTDHAIGPVTGGERVTLTWFIYSHLAAVQEAGDKTTAPEHNVSLLQTLPAPAAIQSNVDAPRRFVCVAEAHTPATTLDSLRAACTKFGAHFDLVFCETLDPLAPPLSPGDMLYRPATSWAAQQAERQLWQPGVRTIWTHPHGPFAVTVEQWLSFARAGLPTPRSIRLTRADQDFLDEAVHRLGGLPLIVRTDDGEGGVGVMRADSTAALRAMAEYFANRRVGARLVSFVEDALHLRIIVAGGRAITAYRNPTRPDDFRSEPSSNPDDYHIPLEPEWADLAAKAAAVAGTSFAGVDLLCHPSGRTYVLEANCPCYFPQAESFGKTNVATALLNSLGQPTEKIQ